LFSPANFVCMARGRAEGFAVVAALKCRRRGVWRSTRPRARSWPTMSIPGYAIGQQNARSLLATGSCRATAPRKAVDVTERGRPWLYMGRTRRGQTRPATNGFPRARKSGPGQAHRARRLDRGPTQATDDRRREWPARKSRPDGTAALRAVEAKDHWQNGGVATLFSAEKARCRGEERKHDTAWCDELAKWKYSAGRVGQSAVWA